MSKNDKRTTNELNQFVPAGLKWLYEIEAVNSPVLLNNLYGNIFSFPNVVDAEILIDKNRRKMLILIRFNWLSRKIFKSRKKEATISILDQLQELLPSFEFRVIEDKALFDLSVKRMTEAVLKGDKNETTTSNAVPSSSDPSAVQSNPNVDAVADAATPTATIETTSQTKSEASKADSKKQSDD